MAMSPQRAGIPAQAFGGVLDPHLGDIRPQQGQRLCAVIYEGRPPGPARQRLQPHRAGACEQVKHLRALDRVAVAAIDQQVEDRLAHPV
jgi:hypothetical protein